MQFAHIGLLPSIDARAGQRGILGQDRRVAFGANAVRLQASWLKFHRAPLALAEVDLRLPVEARHRFGIAAGDRGFHLLR